MLTVSHVEQLAQRLAVIVDGLRSAFEGIGKPHLVRAVAEESERAFQEHAKRLPSKESGYSAALSLLRDQALDDLGTDLVASALCLRIREQGGATVIGSARLPRLLAHYAAEIESGDLWRLTWFGLLGSYFSFDPVSATPDEQRGWRQVQVFLRGTWTVIDRQNRSGVVPDWIETLRLSPELLSEQAALKYGADYLRGGEAAVQQLSATIGIPEGSWFWHELVYGAVLQSTKQSDSRFRADLPKLIELIDKRPVFRDESLEAILNRYHRCESPGVNLELRDYVIRRDVWRNPKLKAAGLATSWNRVSEDVWRMVLRWVNEGNLKDFFEILAAQHNADEGRLEFWSKYIEQISWTRLIFSAETEMLARRDRAVRDLIAREEGAYATLSSTRNVDAFMMQIGNYVIVEFSKTGNAAYVYKSSKLKFDRYAKTYHGGTQDLRYGYYDGCEHKITHRSGWEFDAESALARLHIYADASPKARAQAAPHIAPQKMTPQTRSTALPRRADSASDSMAPPGANFSMESLSHTVSRYEGAYIDDKRSRIRGEGGRLWIVDPNQHQALGSILTNLGFRWAGSRSAYYYPGS